MPAIMGMTIHARQRRFRSFACPASAASRDFHLLATWLSTHSERPRRVIALDYRGRGFSQWDTDKSRYQLPVEAEDVLSACATFDIARAIFIGTSRGGLICIFSPPCARRCSPPLC